MKFFKAPKEIIEQAVEDASPVIEVWPENWDVFNFFLRLSTQWNIVAGFAKIKQVGLRYESVESLMRIERIKNKADFFSDLQTMEFAALSVFNEGS